MDTLLDALAEDVERGAYFEGWGDVSWTVTDVLQDALTGPVHEDEAREVRIALDALIIGALRTGIDEPDARELLQVAVELLLG